MPSKLSTVKILKRAPSQPPPPPSPFWPRASLHLLPQRKRSGGRVSPRGAAGQTKDQADDEHEPAPPRQHTAAGLARDFTHTSRQMIQPAARERGASHSVPVTRPETSFRERCMCWRCGGRRKMFAWERKQTRDARDPSPPRCHAPHCTAKPDRRKLEKREVQYLVSQQ